MDRPGHQPGNAAFLGSGGHPEAAAGGDAEHHDGVMVRDLRAGSWNHGGWGNGAPDRVQRDPVGSLECPEPFGRVRFDTEVGVEAARLTSVGAGDLVGIRVGGHVQDLVGATQRGLPRPGPLHGSRTSVRKFLGLTLETVASDSDNLNHLIQITCDIGQRTGGQNSGRATRDLMEDTCTPLARLAIMPSGQVAVHSSKSVRLSACSWPASSPVGRSPHPHDQPSRQTAPGTSQGRTGG